MGTSTGLRNRHLQGLDYVEPTVPSVCWLHGNFSFWCLAAFLFVVCSLQCGGGWRVRAYSRINVCKKGSPPFSAHAVLSFWLEGANVQARLYDETDPALLGLSHSVVFLAGGLLL